MSAIFKHGDQVMTNWTANSNVSAGGVVVFGTSGLTCGIAHQPISNGQLGALAIGGGVYEVVNLNNAANWTKVYWDSSAAKITTVSTGNPLFGFIVAGGGGGPNSKCLALHMPYV